MFKKASLKILPHPTPVNNNQDVRPIQSLLSAEKAVLLSLQKLSVDYAKAADALKTWGLSEDNDLGGILTASTSLLNHFSLALSQYVTHGHTMQRQLEVMAKKGESLDGLKQRRNSHRQKVEDTANQLNKMNPDNKYFSMHAEALKRLRRDVRKMDEDIRLEETILIDHKQTATKVWLRLKFHGLYECCEKGAIAAKYGKLAVAELEGSGDINQPGMPRNQHLQSKIESFIVQADRDVHAVGLSSAGSRNSASSQESPPLGSYTSPQPEPPHPPPKPQDLSQNARGGNGHYPDSYFSPYPPSNQSQGIVNPSTSPPSQLSRVNEDAVDDFGANGAIHRSNNGRGPAVNTRPPDLSESPGYSLQDPVVAGHRHGSFSAHLQDPPPSHHQPTSHRQNPYPYPVDTRPEPPSQGGRRPTVDSYPAGQWQNSPVIMRPPESSEYPQQDHPSSHWQTPPVVMRPPEAGPSQGGGHLNDDSPYPPGPSHLPSPADRFSTPPRPRGPSESGRYPAVNMRSSESGGYPLHDPPMSSWQNHPSERLPMPPPPPSLGGRHGNPPHLQGPTNTGPHSSSESGGYPSQDSASLNGRHRPGGSSFTASTTGTSQWAPNRFSGVSETTVSSEGMLRAGESSYSQSMDSWGGSDPDESPPAYRLMGGPLPPDTGSKKKW